VEVATYMVGDRAVPIRRTPPAVGLSRSDGFQRLIDCWEVSVEYLSAKWMQARMFCEIFDSWAGSLPDEQFRRWVIEPTNA